MELRPGYKHTEVGVIPKDWGVTALGDVARIKTGSRNNEDKVEDGEYPFFVRSENIERIDSYSHDCEAILVPGEGKIGEIFHYVNGRFDVHQRVYAITRFSPEVSGRFVHLFMRARFGAWAMQNTVKATVDSLRLPTFHNFRVSIPTFPEQSAIATALSDVDALLAAQDALIEKKRAIKQGAMQELLTGKRRLPGFNGEWEVRRLGDHLRFLKNGTNSRAELCTAGSVKYLHYGDIHVSNDVMWDVARRDLPYLPTGKAGKLARLEAGDLVFADASEDLLGVGKSAEISGAADQHAVPGLHTIAVRFDKSVLADGFKAYLQFIPAFRNHLLRLVAGTKVYSTNRAHISGCELALPDIREQADIAGILSEMDADIAALESKREKTAQLKQGMMQALLTGRIRLV